MTRDEIKQAIGPRSDEWLESRWSVLNEAIKAIEPHLAEVEAAFDYDYTAADVPESLEQSVCDQVLKLCNIVTTHDTEVTMSWGELLELIDLEIKRRERLDSARKLKGQSERLIESETSRMAGEMKIKAGDILCDSSGHEVRVLPANTDLGQIECHTKKSGI